MFEAVGIWLYICVHCQSQEYPHISFDGTILTNHSYVDLSLVNENNRNVSCHTDLATCCSSTQGTYRGDWYFPNGERLKFKDCSNCKIYEERDAQRVELRHRSNGNMSGVYRCETPTNTIEKGYVYVGLYHSGGDITMPIGLNFTDHSNFWENKVQFTLSSISTGGPATTVTWMRNSVVIISGLEQESQTVLSNSETAEYIHTLTVTVDCIHTVNMIERVGGVYTCTVSNMKPSNDSSSLIVKVASAPSNLILNQYGETSINVSWTPASPLHALYTTGYRIFYTNNSIDVTTLFSNTSTLITNLESGRSYNISIVGLAIHLPSEPLTSTIYLASLPKDAEVNITTVTKTSTLLSVALGNYDEKVNYTAFVTWRKLHPACRNSTVGTNIEDIESVLTYNITELDPGSLYDISVVMSNAAGNATSNTVIMETEETAPTDAPVIIAISAAVFNVTVTWLPVECIHRNGNITGYSIQYQMRGSGVLMYVNTSILQYTIPELRPSTEYVIGVAAVNNAGIGVYYENLNISTFPFVVSVVSTTSTTVTISWDYINNETNEVISWRMSLPTMCGGDDTNEKRKNSSAPPYVITELEEFSSYNITVCTKNTTVCHSITAITNESAPSAAPTDLTLEGVTSSSISIQWEAVPCAHRNGHITSYIISYKDVKEETLFFKHLFGNQRKTEISGLKPSTQYELHVAAVNSAGTGPFTNQSLMANTSVVTTGGKQQDEGESVGVIVAAASVFSILLVGVTVGTVVLLWRRYIHKEVNRKRRALFQQIT